MRILVLSLLVAIFYFANALKSRSVNLALETILEFDNKADVNLIQSVQRFLDKIKNVIGDQIDDDRNQYDDQRDTRRREGFKFTDFLETLFDTLNSFDDNNLIDTFQIINDEMKSQDIGKSKLFNIEAVRIFLTNKLDEIGSKPVQKIHRDLDDIVTYIRNENEAFYLSFVNSLYKKCSEERLNGFIKQLKLFRHNKTKSRTKLRQLIRDMIHYIILDQYTNLPKQARRDLRTAIQQLANQSVKSYKPKDTLKLRSVIKGKRHHTKTVVTQELETAEESIDSDNTREVTKKKMRKRKRKSNKSKSRLTLHDTAVNRRNKLTHITLYPKSIEVSIKKERFRANSHTETNEGNPNIHENIKNVQEKEQQNYKNIFDGRLTKGLVKTESSSSNEISSGHVETTRKEKKTKKKITKAEKSYENISQDTESGKSIEVFGTLSNYKNDEIIKQSGEKINKKKQRNEEFPQMKNKKGKKIKDSSTKNKSRSSVKDTYRRVYDEDYKNQSTPQNTTPKDTDRNNVSNNVTNNTPDTTVTMNEVVTLKQHDIKTKNTKNDSSTTVTLNQKSSTSNATQATKATDKNSENTTKNSSYEKNTIQSVKNYKEESTTTNFKRMINDTQVDTTYNMTSTTKPSTFDIENFVKKSELIESGDVKKKKELELQMKRDLKELFAKPITNATTTPVFTDIFDDLDADIDID